MRIKQVEVAYGFLTLLLRPHDWERITSDMPDDARVLEAWVDQGRRVIRLTIESATFDDVPELAVMPHFDPLYKRHIRAPWIEALANDLARIERNDP